MEVTRLTMSSFRRQRPSCSKDDTFCDQYDFCTGIQNIVGEFLSWQMNFSHWRWQGGEEQLKGDGGRCGRVLALESDEGRVECPACPNGDGSNRCSQGQMSSQPAALQVHRHRSLPHKELSCTGCNVTILGSAVSQGRGDRVSDSTSHLLLTAVGSCRN